MDQNVQPMDTEENTTRDIDEGLYSRQLYVLGHEAMKKMANSNILLVGLRGLGVEMAKNISLAGVRSITLHDDTPTTLFDLSAQYYLTEKDVGKPRAQACVDKIAELNAYVNIGVHTGELTEEFITKHQVVVLTDQPYETQVKINKICRQKSIHFLTASTHGIFGNVFADFGEHFTVIDPNGEQPASSIIASVTQENPGVVTLVDDHRIPFEEGDYVTFADVQGMTELNSSPARPIKVLGTYTFSIEDTTKYSAYKTGGYVTQVKQPVVHKFLPLQESWENPVFLTSDFAKFDREVPLHLGFRALDLFREKHGHLPAPHN